MGVFYEQDVNIKFTGLEGSWLEIPQDSRSEVQQLIHLKE